MLVVRTSEGRANSLGQLVGTEQTVGLNYLALAVNPFGLYGVEPRALLGQQAGDDPHPFLLALFESPVMLPDPAPHLAAYVPAGIVPDQHQNLLADGGQLLAAPLQKARGYTAHRTALHKAQPRLFELGDVQAVAGDGLRIGIVFFDRLLYKTQRLTSFAKAVQGRLRYSAPPALVFKTHNPIDLILRQPHQPIAPPFFLSYRGSGEVIHLLARCQRTPIRARVARTVSPLMRSLVSPSSKLTSAAISIVHRLLSWPNSLGLWWSRVAQSLRSLLLESAMNGMRAVGTPSKRLLEALLVELVDGVACCLRIAAKITGDLVSVLPVGAGEQDLATAQGEAIRRTQTRLQGLTLGVGQGTHVDWSFHAVKDNY